MEIEKVEQNLKEVKRTERGWRETGSNCYVSLGQWHEYYDWSF